LEIAKPPSSWKSVEDVFEVTYSHEQKVTGLINGLVTLAKEENDHASLNMLQWFVNEQVEEEDTPAHCSSEHVSLVKWGAGYTCLTRSLVHVSSIRRSNQDESSGPRLPLSSFSPVLSEVESLGPTPGTDAIAAAVEHHDICHADAVALWEQLGTRSSRYVAALTADPERLTRMQVSAWVKDIDDVALCDVACDMFSKTRHAYALAPQWCMGSKPMVQRAGYTVISILAHTDTDACDCTFVAYVEMVRSLARDITPGVAPYAASALASIAARSSGLRERVRRLLDDLDNDAALRHELAYAL
jgi:hypothetical protein